MCCRCHISGYLFGQMSFSAKQLLRSAFQPLKPQISYSAKQLRESKERQGTSAHVHWPWYEDITPDYNVSIFWGRCIVTPMGGKTGSWPMEGKVSLFVLLRKICRFFEINGYSTGPNKRGKVGSKWASVTWGGWSPFPEISPTYYQVVSGGGHCRKILRHLNLGSKWGGQWRKNCYHELKCPKYVVKFFEN